MRVNSCSRNNTSFKGILNNKTLLKGLEMVSEHGTSFGAVTSLAMSLSVRPLAIWNTPDTEKENKQYAISNSICSGLVKFAMVEAVALPVEYAVTAIEKSPDKFMRTETISKLKGQASHLIDSKSYKLGSQILKLGVGFITAVPKSVLTIALIPVIMDKLFHMKPPKTQKESSAQKEKDITFSGNLTEKLSKTFGRLFDNKYFQKFLNKYGYTEQNIPKHMSAATDILLTSTFALTTSKSNNIAEERKRPLIYNNIISTLVTLVLGYGLDNVVKHNTTGLMKKFAEVNSKDIKLNKYIQGINILRPALIFASIYYMVLPIFSTYISEKVDKFLSHKTNRQNKINML